MTSIVSGEESLVVLLSRGGVGTDGVRVPGMMQFLTERGHSPGSVAASSTGAVDPAAASPTLIPLPFSFQLFSNNPAGLFYFYDGASRTAFTARLSWGGVGTFPTLAMLKGYRDCRQSWHSADFVDDSTLLLYDRTRSEAQVCKVDRDGVVVVKRTVGRSSEENIWDTFAVIQLDPRAAQAHAAGAAGERTPLQQQPHQSQGRVVMGKPPATAPSTAAATPSARTSRSPARVSPTRRPASSLSSRRSLSSDKEPKPGPRRARPTSSSPAIGATTISARTPPPASPAAPQNPLPLAMDGAFFDSG
jgi:hypothetical protein